jgi:hypothetical protein
LPIIPSLPLSSTFYPYPFSILTYYPTLSYGVGKKERVKKGKRGHALRVSGGENGRLWVGKRRKG